MNNEEYTSAVDRGEWPADATVPLPEPFVNENGEIQNLVLKPMQSVTALRSVKGAVRANHWHRTDWHYTYVASGRVMYVESDGLGPGSGWMKVYEAGQLFFTRPLVRHAMVFLEDSLIITMARNVRSHEEHEADLVRVNVVEPGSALYLRIMRHADR